MFSIVMLQYVTMLVYQRVLWHLPTPQKTKWSSSLCKHERCRWRCRSQLDTCGFAFQIGVGGPEVPYFGRVPSTELRSWSSSFDWWWRDVSTLGARRFLSKLWRKSATSSVVALYFISQGWPMLTDVTTKLWRPIFGDVVKPASPYSYA